MSTIDPTCRQEGNAAPEAGLPYDPPRVQGLRLTPEAAEALT